VEKGFGSYETYPRSRKNTKSEVITKEIGKKYWEYYVSWSIKAVVDMDLIYYSGKPNIFTIAIDSAYDYHCVYSNFREPNDSSVEEVFSRRSI